MLCRGSRLGHKLRTCLPAGRFASLISTCDPDSATSTRFTHLVYRLRLSNPSRVHKQTGLYAIAYLPNVCAVGEIKLRLKFCRHKILSSRYLAMQFADCIMLRHSNLYAGKVVCPLPQHGVHFIHLCRGRDLNSQALRHTLLKRTRPEEILPSAGGGT